MARLNRNLRLVFDYLRMTKKLYPVSRSLIISARAYLPWRKGFVLLSKRWVVERSFGWLSRFRRLSDSLEKEKARVHCQENCSGIQDASPISFRELVERTGINFLPAEQVH